MSIISKMRKQNGVYWGPPVEDGDGGFTFPTPVAIKCRWDGVEGIVHNPRTHDEVQGSTVYVDQEVELNGYLDLGELADVLILNPIDVPTAYKITGFQKTPNLRATEFLLIAELGEGVRNV